MRVIDLLHEQMDFGMLISSFWKLPMKSTSIPTALLSSLLLVTSSPALATVSSDPIAKNCIAQQLRNHQNVKNKSLEASDFNNYCTCVARVVRNLANDQQLSELNTLSNQAKPEWLKAIERNAQKQCMVDPNAKLQST
ncbi:MAG: hypothetical protein RIQ30_1677 [Pseudomonadota bacterium]